MSDPHALSQEREDWRALELSPGWLRWIAYVKSQFGVKAYARQLEEAKDIAERDSIKMAFKMLNELVNYPGDRVASLDRQAEAAEPMAVMSRRGGL